MKKLQKLSFQVIDLSSEPMALDLLCPLLLSAGVTFMGCPIQELQTVSLSDFCTVIPSGFPIPLFLVL